MIKNTKPQNIWKFTQSTTHTLSHKCNSLGHTKIVFSFLAGTVTAVMPWNPCNLGFKFHNKTKNNLYGRFIVLGAFWLYWALFFSAWVFVSIGVVHKKGNCSKSTVIQDTDWWSLWKRFNSYVFYYQCMKYSVWVVASAGASLLSKWRLIRKVTCWDVHVGRLICHKNTPIYVSKWDVEVRGHSLAAILILY